MIKKYFLSWDFARIIKLVFGVLMVIGYFSTKENIYLFGAVFFIVQAAFNIGCQSGTCPITSNPYISIAYGAIIGYLLFDLFRKKEDKKDGND